jgi:hypothetical protein
LSLDFEMGESIRHLGRVRRLSGFLALVAAVLLTVAALAEAKPGYIVTPGQQTAELQMKGTNGFVIQIKLWNGRVLEVSAYKSPDVIVYLTRRVHAQGNRIDATLPRIGRIRVDFQATGRVHREPGFFPPCNGGETAKQEGYFHGTIRLRGERGYTTARATRAHGQIVRTAEEVCKRSIFGDTKPKTEDASRVFAWSSSDGRSVSFSATTLETPNLTSPASVFFSGIVRERRQGMAIFREATARGTSGALAAADESEFPASATATPAAPFGGYATFERMAQGANAWRGNLSVDLPGLGRVALAGSGFAARFCQKGGCRPLG